MISQLDGVRYGHSPHSFGPALILPRVIVIHKTDNPTANAQDEVDYAVARTDGTSAHFYVSTGMIYGSVLLDQQAHGCHPRGNAISWQIEICGMSGTSRGGADFDAANLTVRLCRLAGIPVRKLTPFELRSGASGIVGHADVVAAFHEGDHTDPGWSSSDWEWFIKAAGGPPPSGDLIMAYNLSIGRSGILVAKMQAALNKDTLWHGTGDAMLLEDGDYGVKTAARVKIYQKHYGLVVDGEAGPQTLGHLYNN